MRKKDIDLKERVIIDKYNEGRSLAADDSIASINEAGIDRFKEIGYPSSRSELYSFANIGGVDFANFVPYGNEASGSNGSYPLSKLEGEVYSECRDNCIVFVDGVYNKELSRADKSSISISSIDDPNSYEYGYLIDSISTEYESFALLNAVFLRSVITIRIKARLQEPLELIHVLPKGSSSSNLISPRILFILDEDSSLCLYEKYVGDTKSCFFNYVSDFIVKKGASLNLHLFQKRMSYDTYHFGKFSFLLEDLSKVSITSAFSGTKLTRSHYDVKIRGVGAYFGVNGISILEGMEQNHSYIRVFHEYGDSVSDQVFKSIVIGKSRSSVDTTVIVDKGSDGTKSSQLMQSLVLDDSAESDNKPNLMIFADDVKCNHGATIGNIDDDSLFYLMTRGISFNEARRLLLFGFVQSIVGDIRSSELLSEISSTLLSKLEVQPI